MVKDLFKRHILFNPFALTVISILCTASLLKVVDLQPHVDNEFFFSGDSPQFKTEAKINEMFPLNSQIIISAKGNIHAPAYLRKVKQLTIDLKALKHVTGVKSLINGPDNVDTALQGPLWNRLLISADRKASNVIVFVDNTEPKELIPALERTASYYDGPGFEIKIAGFGFVVELIRRNLVRDFIIFSVLALIIFALMMTALFRCAGIVVGSLVCCLDACILTLVVSQALHVKIGILTANLFTIVFVLTLSHIVFITNNWYRFKADNFPESKAAAKAALLYTINGSFWCMFATFLGFASLIFVQAKPLKELGVSGSVGALVAIFCSYTIYPLFLCSVKKDIKSVLHSYDTKRVFVGHYMWATAALALIAGFCLPGIAKLNTDPSLLTYFKKKSELRQGIEYIDTNGGSSPLNLVISDFYGAPLNSAEAYKRLWALQARLESDPDVGSVISLPVLIAEGRRNPWANFISNETLLRILQDSRYNSVASTFVTADRQYAHFFLRMKETGRTVPRLEVVERIKHLVYQQKFKPDMVGGIYVLQGELAHMVAVSLLGGLSHLALLFVIIAYIVSRSIKTTFAMVGCLAVIPVCMLGAIGHLKIPLDIICAPATNVAIGLGIDSMIHMVIMMRRFTAKGENFWQAWKSARIYLWQPIVSSGIIVATGFGIFAFSMFPPNQRFGLAVVFGTLLAAPIALFVLPSVVGPWFYRE